MAQRNRILPPLGAELRRRTVVATWQGRTLAKGMRVDLSVGGQSQQADKGLILICADLGPLSERLTAWAAGIGTVTMTIPAEVLFFEWMRKYGPDMDMIIVDGTGPRATDKTEVSCEWLRTAAPDLPIIVVSDRLREGQFLPADARYCDVIVPSTVSDAGLEAATVACVRSVSDRAKRSPPASGC